MTDLIAFDTETHMSQPGCLTPKIVCSSWCGDDVFAYVRKGAEDAASILKWYLLTDNIIAGANIAYDFGVCCAQDPSLIPLVFDAYDKNRVFDIQLALLLHFIAEGVVTEFGLNDPRTGKPLMKPSGGRAMYPSLEVATMWLTGRKDAKKNDYWRKRYALLENIQIEQWPADARQYPIDDAKNTYDCAVELRRGKCHNQHQQSEQARAAWALHLSSVWGLRTEGIALDEVQTQFTARLTTHIKDFAPLGLLKKDGGENEGEVKRLVVHAYNPKPEPCAVCFGYGKVKLPNQKKMSACEKCDSSGLNIDGVPLTKKGGIATDRDTLLESGDELLERYAVVSKTKKVLQTYLPALRLGIQHAFTTESNALLNTGRTSYKGIIQTLPKDGGLRECFIAREGKLFCSVDYNGVEMATLAQCLLWICGKSKMADSVNAGRDLHNVLAAQILGITYEEFTKRRDAKDHVAENFRDAAKAGNFGFPGGMGAPTFVISERKKDMRPCVILEQAECGKEKVTSWRGKPTKAVCKRCVELTEMLRDNWMTAYPEMEQYFKHINSIVRGDGIVKQFVSDRLRGGLNYSSAANTYFQALAADGAKKALYRIARESYLDTRSPLFGSRVLIFIHDETFMEHDEATAHEAGMRQAEIMVSTMREYTPDVLIRAEPALCKRWYKKAKAVYNEKGRLIAWEP